MYLLCFFVSVNVWPGRFLSIDLHFSVQILPFLLNSLNVAIDNAKLSSYFVSIYV